MTHKLILVAILSASSLAAADVTCTLTKVAGNDTKVEVHYKPSKMFAEVNCKLDSRHAAETWVADHSACAKDRAVFDYTVVFSVDGKDKSYDLKGYCKKKG